MPRARMVYISAEGHRRLKLLAARQNRPMGKVVEALLERELADLASPWTGPEGLLLQQQALAEVGRERVAGIAREPPSCQGLAAAGD